MSILSVWNPPPTVTDHTGQPLTPDRNSFVAPPPEIGEIRSAFSEMEAGFQDADKAKKVRYALLGGLYMLILGLLLNYFMLHAEPLVLYLTLACMIPLGAIFGYVIAVGFFECHYVGSQGVALYKYEKTPRMLQPNKTMLRFPEAAELRTATTRNYRNGLIELNPPQTTKIHPVVRRV